MKCTIPEISWHNRDPVLSVDVQPLTSEGFYRLASGGTDSHVLIWHLKILETGATTTEPVSDLTRHQRAVNVVRWSPTGQYLASGDDDANIIIWHLKSDDLAVMLDGDNDDKEKWNVFKVLRGHKEDVYDICWSPDSSKLISGSVDNTAIIWDLNKGLSDNILTDHKGFVQGVTWDPLGQYIATLSSDRICRVFTKKGKQVKARLNKGQLPVQESHPLHGQIVRYFHDDTLKSFFRRLTFSPDGNLIIMPAGCLEMGQNNKTLYTSYIYSTNSLTQPAAILPSPGQYTVAARCCPVLYQLRPDGPEPQISLPYRMVFAIATRSSVVLYDTQQMSPFATISNIHYTRLTDLAWSHDGRLLAISSTDGFCSLVTFEPNELGTEYVKEPEVMEQDQNETLNETVEEIMDTSLNVSVDEKKEKKPSFLQKWTKQIQSDEECIGKKNDVDKNQSNTISKIEVRRKPKTPREVTTEKSNEKEIKEEKPISRIEVRRKSKGAKVILEKQNAETETKEEKHVSKIELRRKSKGSETESVKLITETEKKPVSRIEVRRNLKGPEAKTEKLTAPKDEKPISRIAVKRKPKETSDNQEKISNIKIDRKDKPVSKIEIRRKSTGTTENREEKLESTQEKSELKLVEKTSENMEKLDTKTDEEEKSMEVDDDIQIIEVETENNKNKENVLLIQTDINTPTKSKNQNMKTPESSKKKRDSKPGMKIGSQSSIPTKPNAVRKKPGGQLDITQFFKSPGPKITPKTKREKSKLNPVILLQDYLKTGITYEAKKDQENEKKDSNVIIIDDDSSCDVLPVVEQNKENLIEKIDTVEMLIDDDSSCDILPVVPKILNFDEDSQNMKLILEETVDEPIIKTEQDEKMNVDEDNIRLNLNKNNETKESSSKNDVNSSFKKCLLGNENCTNKEENITSGDTKSENCDTKGSISSVEKLEIKKIDKPTPLANVLLLPKGSPAKKRVPLITLSSPKHKKTPF